LWFKFKIVKNVKTAKTYTVCGAFGNFGNRLKFDWFGSGGPQVCTIPGVCKITRVLTFWGTILHLSRTVPGNPETVDSLGEMLKESFGYLLVYIILRAF
jgi:hypothetical protein